MVLANIRLVTWVGLNHMKPLMDYQLQLSILCGWYCLVFFDIISTRTWTSLIVVFVKDSILGNWHKKRGAEGARKIEREVWSAEGDSTKLNWHNSREGAKHKPINLIRTKQSLD